MKENIQRQNMNRMHNKKRWQELTTVQIAYFLIGRKK
jgi:hypothetical protein